MLRPLLVPLLLGLALVAIAAITRSGAFTREDPGRPINSAMRQALGQQTLPPQDAELVAMRYPDAEVTPSGLRQIVRKAGDAGVPPKRGEVVAVHFRGQLLDGTPIDDSYARNEGPFHFVVGQGTAMPGWEEALQTMRPGEVRTLIIPYWLAFGEKGQRGKVPARATVIYDLELLPRR